MFKKIVMIVAAFVSFNASANSTETCTLMGEMGEVIVSLRDSGAPSHLVISEVTKSAANDRLVIFETVLITNIYNNKAITKTIAKEAAYALCLKYF